jgi:phosphonate degradation associated HDIG domain protein
MQRISLKTILDILRSQGHERYGGEAVSQLEHALQCATLAQEQQANPEMVVACLLHDLGHLIHPLGEDAAIHGIDSHHEYRAIPWLQKLFPAAVTEPIRLHVQAKRYLCAVSPDYLSGLSIASQLSLTLQGGIFSPEEAAMFINLPHARAAVQLRRWDDQAKVPGQVTPSLDEFVSVIEHCIYSSPK